MNSTRDHIVVFEHQTLKLNQKIGNVKFDESKLQALQNYYGDKGVPYYSLIHNGVKFNEYVGVIQIDHIIIEVLPKADYSNDSEDKKVFWKSLLIDMLKAVGVFDIHAPSSSRLKIKSNSILDLYFELFINEVEYLLHTGLVKQYRRYEGNVTALKGSIKFGLHIQKNLTHQERFFVRHTVYDTEHQLHKILYKTIRLLQQINTNVSLHSRIGSLLLNFPVMPDIKVTDSSFSKLTYNRKNQRYKKAIEIARLLLLQYHPDVSKGKNYVLALMFDMNLLWERFVFISLRKQKADNVSIHSQTSKYFWKPQNGSRSSIRPDIVVTLNKTDSIVLDTKWKNLKGYNPSSDDLRQMYVYHRYYNASRVALVYPGGISSATGGRFLHPKTNEETEMECNIISIAVESNIKSWQEKIGNVFNEYLQIPIKEPLQ